MAGSEENETREILQRLTRIETLLESMGTARDIATQALSTANDASKRLDKYDKIMFWVTTTIIGAVILGLMSLVVTQGRT